VKKGSARYLLRLDDLCPASDWPRWNPLLALVEELGIRPILAVIPRNLDPELEIAQADPEFWPRLRAWEARGAAIGLHGYRHLSNVRGRGFLPLHRATEFAGAPLEAQRAWIHAGVEMLRGEGLHPRLWVAPRHGFDRHTLTALREEGIALLSDGFASAPFTRGGVTWLPQQLWEPVEKRAGLWTICIHPNTATTAQIDRLRDFLQAHRAEFLSVDEALDEFPPIAFGLSHWLSTEFALGRIGISRMRRRLRAGVGR
jgi:predicted deacetylase